MTTDTATQGYLSEEHKKRFTVTAGVLGALFFIGQMVLPFIVMFAVMPRMMTRTMTQVQVADPAGGAVWEDHLWFVMNTTSFDEGFKGTASIKRIKVGAEGEPEEMGPLGVSGAKLLAGAGRLWIISSSFVGYYEDGEIKSISSNERLGDISRPFLFKDVPAVVEERPGSLRLMLFMEGHWQEYEAFTVKMGEESGPVLPRLQVVAVGEEVHMFLRYGETLYHRTGVPTGRRGDREAWETVSKAGWQWVASVLDGQPVVFCRAANEMDMMSMVGLRPSVDGWEVFHEAEKSFCDDMGVYELESPGHFVILTQLMPGSFRAAEVRDGKTVSSIRYGEAFPFGGGFMYMMFIPHVAMLFVPLVLAFILSSLMMKHRSVEHGAESGVVIYASLARRAMAQVVDAAFLAGPMVAGWLSMMRTVMDPEMMMEKGPVFMFSGMGLMVGGMAWVVACAFIFSWLEGRWGRTPGKWVAGIQVVGTDHQPCGFGRALIRNLLKALDGFFSFMVGILLIALTENWQRVGDMAARTVVIDVRKTQAMLSELDRKAPPLPEG